MTDDARSHSIKLALLLKKIKDYEQDLTDVIEGLAGHETVKIKNILKTNRSVSPTTGRIMVEYFDLGNPALYAVCYFNADETSKCWFSTDKNRTRTQVVSKLLVDTARLYVDMQPMSEWMEHEIPNQLTLRDPRAFLTWLYETKRNEDIDKELIRLKESIEHE